MKQLYEQLNFFSNNLTICERNIKYILNNDIKQSLNNDVKLIKKIWLIE